MGNESTKSPHKPGPGPSSERFSEDESQQLRKFFNGIKEPKALNLKHLWKGKIDSQLEQLILQYLSNPDEKTSINYKEFEKMFAYLVRGTIDDKSAMMIAILTHSSHASTVTRAELQNFAESLIKSYILINIKYGWETSSSVQVKSLCNTLCNDLPDNVDQASLSTWLINCPKVIAVQSSVLGSLCKIKSLIHHLVPKCKNFKMKSMLDICSVMFINSHLPVAFRSEWRLLFSSASHGESFSKFLGFIQNKGPTVLIVSDKDGHMFGGFAPVAWFLSPNYVGDDTAFLFRVKPTMIVCSTTGYNKNYQYINTQQQTMPNGLGMGGTFGYWGLWLDAEYGKGQCSESCTTFRNYQMLSAQKEFRIDRLEAWAVGPLSDSDASPSHRSILDSNNEARALLEMSGKASHSDGMREPE